MQGLGMPRKRRTFKLDDRVLDALAVAAQRDNSSANNWLESLLINVLREKGVLPSGFEPLGETRGGKAGGKDDEA